MALLTFLCIALSLFVGAFGSRILHKGPARGQPARIIRGRTTTSVVGGTNARHVVDFQASLLTDTLFWEEHEQTGVTMDSCAPIKRATRRSRLVLAGANLDIDDYVTGGVLAILKEDYTRICGQPLPPNYDDIPEDDPSLYFRIRKAKDATEAGVYKVKLSVRMISRHFVVGDVQASVREALIRRTPKNAVIFDDSPGFHVADRHLTNTSLPAVASRFSLSKTINKNLGSGGSMGVQLSAGGSFKEWKIEVKMPCKWKGLKLKCSIEGIAKWTQKLDASAGVGLTFSSGYSKDASGALGQWPVSGGFKVKPPFIGTVQLGPFIKLDWVADMSVATSTTMSMSVSYAKEERCEADVVSGSFKCSVRENSGGGDASVAFDGQATSGVEANGFIGVRPAYGVGAKFGSKAEIEANVGAKLGMYTKVEGRNPAYSAYSGNALTLGICNKCHWAEGEIGVQAKDLSVELSTGGSSKDWVLLDDLFKIPLGKMCAIEADSC